MALVRKWLSAYARRLALAIVFGMGLVAARGDYTTAVNAGSNWGTWDGWGTSLCWWANVFGTRDDLANIVFTTNYTVLNGQSLPGLGMNIARYNAGGCAPNIINGETMQASPNIPGFKQIQGYWLDWFSADPASTSWNWAADSNQRAMLLKAKARGANLLELFSNSPMWWMCYNHNPSGADDGASDNLQAWNYNQHAVYLATVARYAADHWGITFDSVEAFNEPSANWWNSTGTQEGCHFAVATQAAVIGYLRTELNSRGLAAMKVAASDETAYDAATSTWTSFSPTTQSQIGRVNVHGYQYGGGRRDLLFGAVSGKKLWDSEYGEGDGTGLSLASNLNLDFRWLHPTGWCYWQVFDSGGWGLIQANPGDNWIGQANLKYYVLAHYTRHIRPGMTILDAGDGNTVAAYDGTAHKLVLVTMNYGAAQRITYDLTGFYSAVGPVRRWSTATGVSPRYAAYNDTAITGKIFSAAFTTNTIQTFEVQNVFITPNPPPVPAGLAALGGVGKVRLNWGPSPGATSYNIKRSGPPGSPLASLAFVTTTNYTDTAVTNETVYTYMVAALGPGGESNYSAPASATSHAPPSLAVARSSGSNRLTFSWPNWASPATVLAATNLVPPVTWQVLGAMPASNQAVLYFSLPATNQQPQFFRLGF